MTGKKVACGACNKDIGKGGSVQCDMCLQWFHLRCADMSEVFCASMSKQTGIFFKCDKCREIPTNIKDLVLHMNQLHAKLDAISNQLELQRMESEKLIERSICNLRAEFVTRLGKTENDLASCQTRALQMDTTIEKKIKKQDEAINVVYHRANRTDVVINGLPAATPNLEYVVVNLCNIYGIAIHENDIQHVCFMNKSKSVLVKFKCVRIRDTLMAEYHKTRTLKLSDIINGDVHSRVFLNDHYAPMAAKMNFMCKQLLKKKKIKKFKIYNADKPKVTIYLMDGSSVSKDIYECETLFADAAV